MSFKIITQGNVLMRGKNKDVTACDLQIATEVSQAPLTFIFKVYEWVEEGEEKRLLQTLTSVYQATCRPHPTPQSPP